MSFRQLIAAFDGSPPAVDALALALRLRGTDDALTLVVLGTTIAKTADAGFREIGTATCAASSAAHQGSRARRIPAPSDFELASQP